MEQVAENGGEVQGLPPAEMEALMTELLAGKGAGGPATTAETGAAGEWDKLTTLTGGFVPVGSIFWARPPKLKNQQRIMLAMREAERSIEGEDAIGAAIKQSEILCKLASELFFVQEAGEFRPATADEIGGDEVGMDAQELTTAFYRLMGIDLNAPEPPGNA